MKPLVLFLGNYLLSDDRVGLEVGERLKERLIQEGYDVELVEKSGLALLDHLEGRSEVIIVDSIKSGQHSVGTVVTPSIEEFERLSVFSPHYAGVPEALQILKALGMDQGCKVHIIAVEVEDPYSVGDQLSKRLRDRLDQIVKNVHRLISCLK